MFKSHFSCFFCENLTSNICSGPTSRIFWLDLFSLVTWDDLDLFYGHKAQVTMQMPDTLSMPIHWLCLRLTSKFCSPMSQSPKCLTFQLWPDLWRHQWSLGQFSHHVWKVYVQGYRMSVEFCKYLHRSSCLRDHGEGWYGPPTGCVTCQTPTERGLNRGSSLLGHEAIDEIAFLLFSGHWPDIRGHRLSKNLKPRRGYNGRGDGGYSPSLDRFFFWKKLKINKIKN